MKSLVPGCLARVLGSAVWILCASWSGPWATGAHADPAEAVARGDAAYARRQLAAAAADYGAALRESPKDVLALCRLVRAESELAEDTTGDAQRGLIASSVEHARAAVSAAPDSALGHVWLSVALGRQAQHEGPRARLALAREIKSEADRALAIDPQNARAFHVLGVWNRSLATLSFVERTGASLVGGVPKGASLENAVANLEKAAALEPKYVNHHLELARTYHAAHRDADARREVEKALSLEPTSSARDLRYQAEARELQAQLPRTP
jgi:tetratricopeptide (TPR) repeat protein